MEKKITKKDILTAIATLISEGTEIQVGETVVTGNDIARYIDLTIQQLDRKAEKARERAIEKKTEGDALRDAVAAVLTDDFQSIDTITSQVNVEDVTKSKVTARLTQLCKIGLAHKSQIKTEDGRKVMGYAAGSEVIDEFPVDDKPSQD